MTGPGQLGEFDLIARYLAPLSRDMPGSFDLTDDAAALAPPPGCDLVLTTDAMIEGVHFLASDGPRSIARKALRVNLSDLAAKGAQPYCYQMVLGLPQAPDASWMADFAAGLAADQAEFGIALSGGDTVRQPDRLLVSITAIGLVPAGGMLKRKGARVGDALYVSGTIGDAALALRARLHGERFPPDALAHFGQRLDLPTPRVALGQGLAGIAHAALDVSDGLVQDAGHLAALAGLTVRIEAARVPLSSPAAACVKERPDLLPAMLSGGDDYEILFAAPAEAEPELRKLSQTCGVAITRIGAFASSDGAAGASVLDADGRPMALRAGGFQHF